jgi:hypothetical protein
VKPESCRYAFTKLAHAAAKPAHQHLSYCPSDKPSLIGPVSTEPKRVRQFFEGMQYQQSDCCVILNR